MCSDLFPAECYLKSNSIYKCTAGGDPELVKTCGATKECKRLDDGATCISKDCRCTEDGVSCGKVFAVSCELKQTALYDCMKEETPKFKKNCDPNGCTASKDSIDKAATVFLASAQDVGNDLCKCQERGIVCGNTLLNWCRMEKGALYKYDEAGDALVVDKKCPHGKCFASGGDDSCREPVISDCACPSDGGMHCLRIRSCRCLQG